MNLRTFAEADNAFLVEDATNGFATSITLKPPAIAAVLTAQAEGTNGVTIPSGTLWKNGTKLYRQTASAIISGGVASIAITAQAAGASENLDDGAALTLNTAIPGITGATVTGTTTPGADPEINVNGIYNRVGVDIDPQTGLLIRGDKSAITVRISALGGQIPVIDSWVFEVNDITGALVRRKILDVIPDKTAGRYTILGKK